MGTENKIPTQTTKEAFELAVSAYRCLRKAWEGISKAEDISFGGKSSYCHDITKALWRLDSVIFQLCTEFPDHFTFEFKEDY